MARAYRSIAEALPKSESFACASPVRDRVRKRLQQFGVPLFVQHRERGGEAIGSRAIRRHDRRLAAVRQSEPRVRIHNYRLATDAEWTRAAQAGIGGTVTAARHDSLAWHAGNAGGKAHPVATRQPDALGVYDMLGNVAEWVTGMDGRPLVRGGSWADAPEQVGPGTRAVQTSAWNETDPQFPKSRWWLADAPFVGFRIVLLP